MVIVGIRVSKVLGLARCELQGLPRLARMSGPLEQRASLRSAFTLAMGALGEARPLLESAGLKTLSVAEAPESEHHFAEPARLRGWVDPQERTVQVDLQVELDPPQFGLLRELAFKDPVLAEAMGPQLLRLELRCGWAFTRDLSIGDASVLGLRLGELDISPSTEAFKVLAPLLKGMQGRVRIHNTWDHPLEMLAAATRSPDPSTREDLESLQRALCASPFNLGRVSVIDGEQGSWLALGPTLRPVQDLGPAAQAAVSLLCAIYLDPAEILVLDHPGLLLESGPAVMRWLERLLEAPGGPLEQLIVLSRRGGVPITDRGLRRRASPMTPLSLH